MGSNSATHRDPLSEIARKYPTDKVGHHEYTPIYHRHLEKRRNEDIVLIEHGVGGYRFPDRGGGGLQMWQEYFPNGTVVGTDIYNKNGLNLGDRIKIYQGGQDSPFLRDKIILDKGVPDFVVDDASHNCIKTVLTFDLWWPYLKDGGIYFVEDVHTSYWNSEEYQGDDSGNPSIGTTVNFFKKLADVVNWQHIGKKENYEGLDKYLDIASISFYPELIVIEKL